MTAADNRCECCGNTDHPLGVSASGIGAFSIFWCEICHLMAAEPKWALDAIGDVNPAIGLVYFDGESYRDYCTNKIEPIKFNDGRKFETRAEAVDALAEMEKS